jgi:hypothetical protein
MKPEICSYALAALIAITTAPSALADTLYIKAGQLLNPVDGRARHWGNQTVAAFSSM